MSDHTTLVLEKTPGLGAVIIKRYGPRLRVAVDPAVVDRAHLKVLLRIYGAGGR
jgi:hypothetical protein